MAGTAARSGLDGHGSRRRRRHAMVPSQRPALSWRFHPDLCALADRDSAEMPPHGVAGAGTAIGARCAADHAHGPHGALPDPGIHHVPDPYSASAEYAPRSSPCRCIEQSQDGACPPGRVRPAPQPAADQAVEEVSTDRLDQGAHPPRRRNPPAAGAGAIARLPEFLAPHSAHANTSRSAPPPFRGSGTRGRAPPATPGPSPVPVHQRWS